MGLNVMGLYVMGFYVMGLYVMVYMSQESVVDIKCQEPLSKLE